MDLRLCKSAPILRGREHADETGALFFLLAAGNVERNLNDLQA